MEPLLVTDARTWDGIDFVQVPKGGFVMGSVDDNEFAGDYEKPQHIFEIPLA